MKLYTIGFTKKSAEEFFTLLKKHSIKKVIDIRLNNGSQLAGFSKGKDLEYFLREICGIEYEHNISLAPTKGILDNYKQKKISWFDYEEQFKSLLVNRNIKDNLNRHTDKNDDGICLLCSEELANYCHRRLVAEFLKSLNPEIEIIHI